MNDGDNIEEPEQTVFRVRRHGKIKVTRAAGVCVMVLSLSLCANPRADLRLPEATLNRFKEGEGHCGGRWSRAATSSCS